LGPLFVAKLMWHLSCRRRERSSFHYIDTLWANRFHG
jgi:hypothetical protein